MPAKIHSTFPSTATHKDTYVSMILTDNFIVAFKSLGDLRVSLFLPITKLLLLAIPFSFSSIFPNSTFHLFVFPLFLAAISPTNVDTLAAKKHSHNCQIYNHIPDVIRLISLTSVIRATSVSPTSRLCWSTYQSIRNRSI